MMNEGSNFRVRRASPDMARHYITLIKGILAEDPAVDTPYAPGEFNPTTSTIRDLISEYDESDNSLFLVAESDDIIGALTCRGGRLAADRHSTALGIYVAQPVRDQGVGGALMRHTIEWAKQSPVVERVELEVFAGNSRAIHLYEKHGFVREGVKQRMYYRHGVPVNMVLMALLLEKKT